MYRRLNGHSTHAHAHGHHAHASHLGHGTWAPRKRNIRHRRNLADKECEPLGIVWVVAIAAGVAFAFFAAMIQITMRAG
jgi:elongation factor P hydroxylase